MPARVCPSLSGLAAPRPTFPTQHGVIAPVHHCLIISADTREAGHYGTSDTPPQLDAQEPLTELTGWGCHEEGGGGEGGLSVLRDRWRGGLVHDELVLAGLHVL
ncbi:hypothetical protein WMY93_021780 [Mugilogobius chulae]|uniref:MHC class I antigen n=1 Tax=Mugilogobius chulae TaxID=88201 RepID=A0AAW0NEU5_9GOBI